MADVRGGGSDPLAREPLWDATFRARMLRQGLSNDEIAQAVEAAENAWSELAGLRGRLAETEAERDDLGRELMEYQESRAHWETEANRLQHLFDCADTPLMRDVMAEREALRVERDTAVAVVEAAQEALTAWVRMPDAGLTDDDPRRAWWFDTAPARDALRAALAAVGGTAA